MYRDFISPQIIKTELKLANNAAQEPIPVSTTPFQRICSCFYPNDDIKIKQLNQRGSDSDSRSSKIDENLVRGISKNFEAISDASSSISNLSNLPSTPPRW